MPKTKKSKKKFYAVASGRRTGIYNNWAECELQVKGFSCARYKSFSSRLEADAFMQQTPSAVKPSAVKAPPKKRPGIAEKPELAASSKFPLSIVIHFDGGSRGNPGSGGAGAEVVVTEIINGSEENQETIHIRKYLGKVTNNIAEYEGLLCGLRRAESVVSDFIKKRNGESCAVNIQVKGDSDLIIQQQNGSYECRSRNLVPLYAQATSIVADIRSSADVAISFKHVYRKDNKVADALANEAMDNKKTWTTTDVTTTRERKVATTESTRTTEV